MSYHIYTIIIRGMRDSIITAIQHPFFLRSLLIGVLLASIFPLYGNIVVVRQEANIAHTFAHIGLLGVATGLWFDWPIVWTILGSVAITVMYLFFVTSKKSESQVANNEIGAQLGLVGAILLISQISGYKADISSYLFGDILLLGQNDIYIILAIIIVTLGLFIVFGKKRYAISLETSLARSKGIAINRHYFVYLMALGILIGGAMKIIGVLLVSAFLILSSNSAKRLAKNKKSRNIISSLLGCTTTIIGLFVARHFDLPSGATIIAIMLIVYLAIVASQKP